MRTSVAQGRCSRAASLAAIPASIANDAATLSARVRADLALTERIAAIHARSRQTCGAPRVHAELQVCGDRHGRERVARLMLHAAGLAGRIPKRYRHTTVAAPLTVIPDLVRRDFTPTHPDQLRVGDIDRRPDLGGLAVPGDPPRLLLAPGGGLGDGRSPAHRAAAPGPAHGPGPAPPHRAPDPPHRPRLPGRNTSEAYTNVLTSHGIRSSLSRPANCWDNAVAESFFSILKLDLLYRHSWPTRAAARSAVFEYIEVLYNRERRHSTLGSLSLADYESDHPAVCSA